MQRCHVCSSPEFDCVIDESDRNLELDRCRSCGFVYLASWERSLENADSLYDYYAELTDEDLVRRHSPENRLRQQQLLRKLGSQTRGRKLLDVGCGDGQLLRTAEGEDWNASGIDLSSGAIALCQRQGLPASKTDFFDAALDAKRFDVVVMSELLEHVPSPQRFLQRAESLLEERGVLYLTTPNFGSLARRMLGGKWSIIHPEHIGYFERDSLRNMLRRHTGLQEIEIEANNIAPSTFIAWLRSRRAQSPAAPLAEVHQESRTGPDQELRRIIHGNRVLAASKPLVNRMVSRAGLGETLVAWLRKPSERG